MTRAFCCLIVAVASVLAIQPDTAMAQVNQGAVLFDGLLASRFKSPAGQNEGESYPVDRFSPGVEYRTNPRGRVSWGIGYHRQNVPSQTIVDEQIFTDPMGTVIGHYINEDEFEAKLDVISVTAYINILTRSIVQPFVGIGGGVGIAKAEGTYTFMDVLNPQFSDAYPYTEKTYDLVLKGVAGASYFPHERVIVSGGGGYQNGGAGFFQVGVVF